MDNSAQKIPAGLAAGRVLSPWWFGQQECGGLCGEHQHDVEPCGGIKVGRKGEAGGGKDKKTNAAALSIRGRLVMRLACLDAPGELVYSGQYFVGGIGIHALGGDRDGAVLPEEDGCSGNCWVLVVTVN